MKSISSSVLVVFHQIVFQLLFSHKLIGKGHKDMGRVIWSLASHNNSQPFPSLHLSTLNCMVSSQCQPLVLLQYCAQVPTCLGCIMAHLFWPILLPFLILKSSFFWFSTSPPASNLFVVFTLLNYYGNQVGRILSWFSIIIFLLLICQDGHTKQGLQYIQTSTTIIWFQNIFLICVGKGHYRKLKINNVYIVHNHLVHPNSTFFKRQ